MNKRNIFLFSIILLFMIHIRYAIALDENLLWNNFGKTLGTSHFSNKTKTIMGGSDTQ